MIWRRSDEGASLRGRGARALTVVGTAAILLWLAGHVADVLLLAFAGVLLGVFLQGLGSWVAKRTPLSERWAIGAVCLLLVTSLAGAVWVAAPEVAAQADELSRTLPRAVDDLGSKLDDFEWGRRIRDAQGDVGEALTRRDTLVRAGTLLSSGLGALAGLVVFLFVGLFVAFEPRLYRAGLLRLIPIERRPRSSEILDELGHVLRQWMAGKVFAMAVVGVLTWLGLLLLGIPLGLTLALLAAILTFIPNFGPVLSAVPAVLLGLMEGPGKAAAVVALYVGIQTVESYILTPFVQKKTISLPPALTIMAQVLMGALVGGLGLLVATPLAAAVLVLVKHVYVRDVLGDAGEQDGAEARTASAPSEDPISSPAPRPSAPGASPA